MVHLPGYSLNKGREQTVETSRSHYHQQSKNTDSPTRHAAPSLTVDSEQVSSTRYGLFLRKPNLSLDLRFIKRFPNGSFMVVDAPCATTEEGYGARRQFGTTGLRRATIT